MNVDDKIKCAVLGCAVGIVCLVIIMFMGGAFYGWQSPPRVNEFLTGLGSTSMGIIVVIASFYFGSSKGSQNKDATIAALAANGHTTETKAP